MNDITLISESKGLDFIKEIKSTRNTSLSSKRLKKNTVESISEEDNENLCFT